MKKMIGNTLLFLLFPLLIYSQNNVEEMLDKADSLIKTNCDEGIALAKTIEKHNQDNPEIMYKTVTLLSRAYDKKSEYDSAFYYLMKERDYALLFRDSAALYLTYSDLGWIYAFRKEYLKSIEQYKLAKQYFGGYARIKRNDDKSNRNYARLLNSIGTMYIKLGEYDSSLTYLYSSLKLRKKINAPPKMIIAAEYSIATCYIVMKDYEKAEAQFKKVLKLTVEHNDSVFMAKTYNNLGILYANRKKPDKAIEAYHKALTISEKLGMKRSSAHSYHNLGDLYLEEGKYGLAKVFFQKTLQFYKEQNINASNIYLSLGQLSFNQGDYNQSIEYCTRALSMAEESGDNKISLGSNELLYESYKALGDYRKALEYFEKKSSLQTAQIEESRREYAEKLKEEFETEQKKKEIEYLKTINASEKKAAQLIRTRQNIIIVSIILGLVFLVITLFSVIQKRKKEKLLYASEKKYLKAHLLNSELEKKQLDEEVKMKSRELTTHTLNMIQKNQLVDDVLKKLVVVSKEVEDTQRQRINTVIRELGRSKKSAKDWELFKFYFESVHREFNNKLKAINPNLNAYDYRLAALIYLNLNIKESAALLNISPNSVKVARYRLRKRLKLKQEDDLYVFLNSL